VTRELAGNLPGQVRAGSGIASSTGSVTFVAADGRTPWKAGPVLPGGLCSIDAAEDVGEFTTTTGGDPYAAAIASYSPLFWWKLDGAAATDASGNGRDGTLDGTAPTTASGLFTNSASSAAFSASAGRYLQPYASFMQTVPFTIVFWFQTATTASGDAYLVARREGGGVTLGVRLQTGTLSCFVGASASLSNVSGAVVPANGVPHMGVLVVDSTRQDLYIDGVHAMERTGSVNYASDTTRPLWVGSSDGSGAGVVSARTVDDVSWLPLALTAAQVADLYTASSMTGSVTTFTPKPLVPAARMTVRSVSAAGAMTPERTADLEDVGITRKLTLPTVIATDALSPVDAAYVIDRCARAMGYYATPSTASSAILCVHGCGGTVPEVGSWDSSVTIVDGQIAYGTDDSGRVYAYATTGPELGMASAWSVGQTIYITTTVPDVTAAYTAFAFDSASTIGDGPQLLISATGVSAYYGAGSSFIAQHARDDGRIQVKLTRTSSTVVQVSVRSAAGAAFTTPVSVTGVAVTADFTRGSAGGQWLGLQISTDDGGADIWLEGNATIAATGSVLQAILPGDAQTAWGLVQDVAQSTLGAAWIDGSGTLVYRAKEAMRGAQGVTGTVDALESIVDLPWSIATDDVADRVEIDYSPPDVQTGSQTVTVWQTSDVLSISNGQTRTQIVTLDGAVDGIAPFFQIGDTLGGDDSVMSRVQANTKADGTGTVAVVYTVRATLITPSKVKLTISRPLTDAVPIPIYFVDTSGNPAITMRAQSTYAASPDQTSSVASGVSETRATNPLTIDCGAWVQDPNTASEFQSWLAGMVAEPLATLSQVQVVPNSAINIGDVWRINDPLYTGLSAKCLVTGAVLTGAPGSLTQTLDLVILGVSVQDVDDYITSLGTVTTIADLDTAITTALGASPTIDQVQAWLETGAS